MQFNFSYAQNVSQIQIAAFEMAGRIWSSYLTDKVTINIAVDVQKDFIGNTIAGAIPRINGYSFNAFNTALRKDSTSNIDRTALNSLVFKDPDQFEVRFDKTPTSFEDEKIASKLINVSSANAKALGLDNSPSNVLDGNIVMRDLTGTNTSWHYNFTRSNTTPANSVDFISVAIHEIGHILGFQSGIDQPWVSSANLRSNEYSESLNNRANAASPLDLFRYSEKSQIGSNVEKLNDLAVGGTPYLSLGGSTVLGSFETGVSVALGGSGKQASHWKSGGIMDAEIQRGVVPVITNLDLTAFDAIGWNIASSGINKAINNTQLAAQSMLAAVQKKTQNINDAIALMFDSADIYQPKTIVNPNLEARKGGWWQEFFARKGGWWQEFFARKGGWWQGIKEVYGEEAIFDSIEGGDIELLQSSYNQLNDSSDINPLTGKTEDAVLVGEVIAQRQFFQRNDVELLQPSIGFQNSGFSLFDRQDTNRIIEFSPSTESAFSNVVGNRNVPNLDSVISTNFQLTDKSAFAPLVESNWWMSR